MAKGENYRPVPLDFLLLAAMPEKGMVGGIHWQGRRVKDLRDQILEENGLARGELTSSQVQARLRALAVEGHVENFQSIGKGVIWARTISGSAHLDRKAELLGLPPEPLPDATSSLRPIIHDGGDR